MPSHLVLGGLQQVRVQLEHGSLSVMFWQAPLVVWVEEAMNVEVIDELFKYHGLQILLSSMR